MQFNHIPVLLNEAIEGLGLKEGMTVADCTTGGAGHSKEIKKRIGTSGKLICIDKDNEALDYAKTQVEATFIHANFAEVNLDNTDAIIADLGVSSHQIDTAERGFSYTKDAALDMRMDKEQKRDAYHVVNNYRPERLQQIIEMYGEERYAKQIAKAITAARPIKTTSKLASVISNAVPGSYYKTGGHPAKRTFQAIRIEVNGELEVLERFIKNAVKGLNIGGRLAIITFHSLEDRIVKQTFKELATECICPPKTPKCICNHKASVRIITKKPIEPTQQEIKDNPRAASAKLRIAEKI